MDNTIHDLRTVIGNRTKALTAKAELGKLGIVLKEQRDVPANCLERSEALERRAELRRASNALSSHGREKHENLTDNLVTALEYVHAEINLISIGLDLEDSANARLGSGSGAAESELRDHSGQKIGTMLANADLRDAGRIAAKLGAHSNSTGGDMSLGDFFRGVAGMRTNEAVRASLSEGTNSAGGYTVPSILLPGILNALVPASALLQAGANVAVINQQASSFKIAATDTIPTAAWRSENGSVAESDPAFRSITITPRSLAFRFKVSRELLQDSPGLDTALRTAIAQAFGKELDRAGLRGSGTAPEIRGLLNITGVNAVDMALPDGAAMTNYNKFINATRLIKDADAPAPTAAIVSTREDETIALFADTTGQPLRRPEALSDWKFITSSQIPINLTVGASSDCSEAYVGNFGLFTYFIREGVSVQLLNELYAETGQVGFVCHTRVDVAAMYAKAFAVITGITA
ncbi:phage major capsid protein [Cognatiluteimonas telluris]|uniref:phage major capsid protein n=1 Tax=Cognatiluteimonas telluris TaxID=1104775 RepID=UPI00140C0B3A|nr:phage major capsid protein [Lysobacter telluris]